MVYLKRNLPRWERLSRLAAGVGLAGATLLGLPLGWGAWLSLAGAAILALTGVVGFCPACALVGRKP